MTTLPSPIRVGSVQFEAGAKVADVQAAIDREALEMQWFRVRVFASRRVEGTAHSTACTIWGDDGQGGTAENFAQPLPCNCGALINFATKQTAEVLAVNRDEGADDAAAHAEVKRLREALEPFAKCGARLASEAEIERDDEDEVPWLSVIGSKVGDVPTRDDFRRAAQALSAPPTPDDAGWKDRAEGGW